MFRKLLCTVAAACVLAVSAMAQAQPSNSPYQKKLEVEFKEIENILGTVTGPNGTLVKVDGYKKHPSLIEYRKNFVPEMIATTEDI